MHNRYKVWFFIERELRELVPIFSSIFKCQDLIYDCENVWEWCEGFSDLLDSKINIGRDHGGSKFDDDDTMAPYENRPIMIMWNYDKSPVSDLSQYTEVAKEISDHLRLTTYYGYLTVNPDDSYEYQPLVSF